MAKLLLIKTEDTQFKKIGDIVGIFEDGHNFSEREREAFDIMDIPGYSAGELRQAMPNPETRVAYRTSAPANEFSFELPESRDFWRENSDSKWKAYEKPVKYELNINDLSVADRESLSASETSVSRPVKQEILNRLRQRAADDPENMVESSDLNQAIVVER